MMEQLADFMQEELGDNLVLQKLFAVWEMFGGDVPYDYVWCILDERQEHE